MRVANTVFWNGADFEADTGYQSYALWLGHIAGCGIQVDFLSDTGVSGILRLEASCENGGEFNPQNPPTITKWTPIADSDFTLDAETEGNYMWNVADSFYRWIRVVFIPDEGGSDAAIVNGQFNAKGV